MTKYIDRTGEPDDVFEREVLARVEDPMAPVPSSPVALLDQLDELRANATPGPWSAEPNYRLEDGCRCLSCWEPIPGSWDIDPVDGPDCEMHDCFHAIRIGEADAALIVAAVNAVGPLTAAVRAVLNEHRPMANSPGRQPACPDCLGGIYATDPDAARSCGCWGLATPVCSSCADKDGPRLHPVQWPCRTVAAISAALSVTP